MNGSKYAAVSSWAGKKISSGFQGFHLRVIDGLYEKNKKELSVELDENRKALEI